jgi:hypothetical protein
MASQLGEADIDFVQPLEGAVCHVGSMLAQSLQVEPSPVPGNDGSDSSQI